MSIQISSFDGLMDFCILRMQEGKAAEAASRGPQTLNLSVLDERTEQLVREKLAAGDYLDIVKAVCRRLPAGRRLSFLNAHAKWHGPLLFEQAAAIAAEALRNDRLSPSEKLGELNTCPAILAKAWVATGVLEFLGRNMTTASYFKRNEECRLRLGNAGLASILACISSSEDEIKAYKNRLKMELAGNSEMMLNERLHLIYNAALENLKKKYAAESEPASSPSERNVDGLQVTVDRYLAIIEFRQNLNCGLPLEGPESWNESSSRERLHPFLDILRTNALEAIKKYIKFDSNRNEEYSEAAARLEEIVIRFEAGAITTQELSQQIREFSTASDQPQEQDVNEDTIAAQLRAKFDRLCSMSQEELMEEMNRKSQEMNRRLKWHQAQFRAHEDSSSGADPKPGCVIS